MDFSTKQKIIAEVKLKYSDGPCTGIFTDGGARPNPGPGAWAFVYVIDSEVIESQVGFEKDTTNNRMEMTAVLSALEYYDDKTPLTLYADSQLCVNTLNIWAKSWEKNNWKRKSGSIKNLDLVQKAYNIFQTKNNIEIKWTAGHGGWRWNEAVDSLAGYLIEERKMQGI